MKDRFDRSKPIKIIPNHDNGVIITHDELNKIIDLKHYIEVKQKSFSTNDPFIRQRRKKKPNSSKWGKKYF